MREVDSVNCITHNSGIMSLPLPKTEINPLEKYNVTTQRISISCVIKVVFGL